MESPLYFTYLYRRHAPDVLRFALYLSGDRTVAEDIVSETFAEVHACAKGGIMINTFMLARDPDRVAFVRRVASVCRGKAYFTTPATLGQYVLLDYMNRKTKTIH